MTVTTAVVVLPRRVAVWASRRALARNSLTGIELACTLCAAVWFSAGPPSPPWPGRGPGRRVPGPAGGWPAHRGAFDGWLAGTCALAGELAVYAGLAAGANPAGPGLGPGHRSRAAARDAEGGPAAPSGSLTGRVARVA